MCRLNGTQLTVAFGPLSVILGYMCQRSGLWNWDFDASKQWEKEGWNYISGEGTHPRVKLVLSEVWNGVWKTREEAPETERAKKKRGWRKAFVSAEHLQERMNMSGGVGLISIVVWKSEFTACFVWRISEYLCGASSPRADSFEWDSEVQSEPNWMARGQNSVGRMGIRPTFHPSLQRCASNFAVSWPLILRAANK